MCNLFACLRWRPHIPDSLALLEDRLQEEQDYVLEEFHLRPDLAISKGTSVTSTQALGEKYPDYTVEDVHVHHIACTFPIPPLIFHERNGVTVLQQMLALFLPHPPIILGVEVASHDKLLETDADRKSVV